MALESKITGHILAVDDDENIRLMFRNALEPRGYSVNLARDGREARTLIQQNRFDVVIMDVSLPDCNGLEMVSWINKVHPFLKVIICTAYAKDYDFLEAVRAGASDWIAKPFEIQELYAKIERILLEQDQARSLARKNHELERIQGEMKQVLEGMKRVIRGHEGYILQEGIKRHEDFPGIIGNSKEIEKALKLVRIVANTDSSVLITGEIGTGKKLIARSIHALSDRVQRPFIEISCAALPEALVEGVLFGREKGVGLMEKADRGTLFLDEISDITPDLQVKLLSILQEGQFVDVRVIAATSRELENRVQEGIFRIYLPPLRERIEDLPLLAQYFLEKASVEYSRPITGFSSTLMEKMFRYSWPENVQELENMVFQGAILATPPLIDLKDMPTIIEKLHKHPRQSRLTDKPYSEAKVDFEKFYFESILNRTNGNLSAASRLSKMDKKELREKARKLGVLQFAHT